MIPEELFGKIIKYHLLDQEQEADDIRKGLEKKLDAMVNREVYSKFKTAPTEEEMEALLFASKISKHTKSNTIVLATNRQLRGS